MRPKKRVMLHHVTPAKARGDEGEDDAEREARPRDQCGRPCLRGCGGSGGPRSFGAGWRPPPASRPWSRRSEGTRTVRPQRVVAGAAEAPGGGRAAVQDVIEKLDRARRDRLVRGVGVSTFCDSRAGFLNAHPVNVLGLDDEDEAQYSGLWAG